DVRLSVAPVALLSCGAAALDSIRPATAAKAIRLDASVDPTVGPVSGDAARLQQVVWNLVSNAIKFSPVGSWAEVRVEPVAGHAQIRVRDGGRGIDPVFLPHIFERFQQADASSTRSEGGLGLGLAIVRHIVELHGGTVEAASQGEGKGATFTVRVPLPGLGWGGG